MYTIPWDCAKEQYSYAKLKAPGYACNKKSNIGLSDYKLNCLSHNKAVYMKALHQMERTKLVSLCFQEFKALLYTSKICIIIIVCIRKLL